MLIQADDKLEIIAEKTRTDGTGLKIGLAEDWREKAEIAYGENGRPKIYSYWRQSDNSFISPEEHLEIDFLSAGRTGYIPCFERIVRTSIPESYIRLRGNSVFLSLCKLSYTTEEMLFSSRYRKLLETFAETRPGVFEYRNRGGGSRSAVEAARAKLLRFFRLYEYEYNILLLDREEGRRVFEELRDSAAKVYETGLYMKGAGERKGTTVKMYELKDGLFKIELTFRKETFKKLSLDISDMKRQEDCIELLRNSAVLEILKLKGGAAVKQLQFEFIQENNILSRILKLEAGAAVSERRQDSSEERLSALETQLSNMKRIIEKQGLSERL